MRQFKFNSLACRHHFLHDLERNAAADGNVVYAHSLKRDALYALTNVANVTQDHANPRAKIRTIGLSVSLSDAVFHLITNSGNCREPMFLLHALRPQADYFANPTVKATGRQSAFCEVRGTVRGPLFFPSSGRRPSPYLVR